MELLNALGLNFWTLISQLINFGILYFLLNKFALQPLLQKISARQNEIATGLANSQAADQALAHAQEEKETILTQARAQARDIIASARENAQVQEGQILDQAHAQAQDILADAKSQIQEDREKMLQEARGQIAEIVSIGVQKVINEKISPAQINARYLESGLQA